jgi:hypothetical protein
MPNRIGRQIPIDGYNPRGLLPDGLLPVARPGGESAEIASKAADKIADTFGKIADEAAAIEGARAGTVAGNDTGFRPTGSTTLRGRSFDAAGNRSYKDNLDAQMRTDMQSIYEANKNSPADLKKAYDTMGEDYRRRHVFPELLAEFNADFARLRLPFQNKALSNLESNQRDERKAALTNNVTASQTYAARAAAADPNNPATALVVDNEIARIDRLYDSAAKNDVISLEAATKLKAANRNSIMSSALLAQADTLKNPQEIAAYRENVKKQFGAGALKHLDGDGWASVDAQLQQLERGKRTLTNQAETQLKKNVDDFVQRAADGFTVSSAEWTNFAASEGARTAKGQQILALGEAQVKVADMLRTRSIADGEAWLRSLRREVTKDGRAPSEQEADLIRFGEKQLKAQREALNSDPLGLAEKKRIVPQVAPVDFQGFAASDDPAAAGMLAAQIRTRSAQARAVGDTFERQPQFFRPEEKARLKEMVAAGGDKALALAGAIVKGGDTDAPAMLREIAGDAPVFAQAGAIIAGGGSLQAARDALQAGQIKALTKKDLPSVADASRQAVNRDLSGAYVWQSEDFGRIRATADAIAKTRLDRGGVDPKSAEAKSIYARAFQEAAGAQFVSDVQYGGVADYKPGAWWWSTAKVLVPQGVRADAFRDVIRSIRDEDLQGLAVKPVGPGNVPYRARDLAAAVPVAVRGDGYRFARGDPKSDDPKWIRGENGQPFVLPFDRLASILRQRLPRAFLGGE